MAFYTDYPIFQLGDVAGEKAPVRECCPMSYDGNKYLKIAVNGAKYEIEVKSGYVYRNPVRLEDGPKKINHGEWMEMFKDQA